MPSKYEPGGIAQLEALAVGTSVVAHRVGGLSATLTQVSKQGEKVSGNSFLFNSFDSLKFLDAIFEAYNFLGKSSQKIQLIKSTLESKNDWSDRVPYYLSLFQKILGVFDVPLGDEGKFSESRLEILSKVSVNSK